MLLTSPRIDLSIQLPTIRHHAEQLAEAIYEDLSSQVTQDEADGIPRGEWTGKFLVNQNGFVAVLLDYSEGQSVTYSEWAWVDDDGDRHSDESSDDFWEVGEL